MAVSGHNGGYNGGYNGGQGPVDTSSSLPTSHPTQPSRSMVTTGPTQWSSVVTSGGRVAQRNLNVIALEEKPAEALASGPGLNPCASTFSPQPY